VSRRIGNQELVLAGLRGERKRLILAVLAEGKTEREVAELASCAPSFVHRVAAGASG
jgi:hypothetical protein